MTSPEATELVPGSPVRVLAGGGAVRRLGELARSEKATHALLVSDAAIAALGYVEAAAGSLRAAGLHVTPFVGAEPNPTTHTVDRGLACAAGRGIDLIVGLGGGSAMDCAKAINLLLTGGGAMSDYRGDPPAAVLAARKPLLPMILAPTTAGTGSEAQSFALISDADTHMKMACGDRRLPTAGGLRPRWAILDPDLTRTMPRSVAAATGIDALSHAVETAGCRVRTPESRRLSRLAWEKLSQNLERSLRDPGDAAARAEMLLGAHLAGAAIEQAMLGAAHACANPLTARFDTTHGVAVGVMLPAVVRYNASRGANPYSDLLAAGAELAETIEALLSAAGLPRRIRELGVPAEALPELAGLAASQWTAGFNPHPVGAEQLLEVYRAAWG